MIPNPEDLAFIGKQRRCSDCGMSTSMWWIPRYMWDRYTKDDERVSRKHLCVECFLTRVVLKDGMK